MVALYGAELRFGKRGGRCHPRRAGWKRRRERHRLCVVLLSFVSRFRLGPFHGLRVQSVQHQPRRPPPQAGPVLTAASAAPTSYSGRRRNRTPRPPPELVAPSLMNSIPAASRAAMTLVRLSITPRTVPLLASIR